jgi:hypothetical protein
MNDIRFIILLESLPIACKHFEYIDHLCKRQNANKLCYCKGDISKCDLFVRPCDEFGAREDDFR